MKDSKIDTIVQMMHEAHDETTKKALGAELTKAILDSNRPHDNKKERKMRWYC